MNKVICVITHNPVDNTYDKYSYPEWVIATRTGENFDEAVIGKADNSITILIKQQHVTHEYIEHIKPKQ